MIAHPQELNLCPHLSVAENIVLGNQIGGWLGIDQKATRRVAEEHLAEIDDRIDPKSKVGDLSAAAQQLVQIARATATRADILIFDEPTAALTDREAKSLFSDSSYASEEQGGAELTSPIAWMKSLNTETAFLCFVTAHISGTGSA